MLKNSETSIFATDWFASPIRNATMIPAEALGCWNVAARDQSKEFFNAIHPQRSVTGYQANGSSRSKPALRK
jgi:hypothetical protein